MTSPDLTGGMYGFLATVIKDHEARSERANERRALIEMKARMEYVLSINGDYDPEVDGVVTPWAPVEVEGLTIGQSFIRFVKPHYRRYPKDNDFDRYRIEGRITDLNGVDNNGVLARIKGNDSLYSGRGALADRIGIGNPGFQTAQGLINEQFALSLQIDKTTPATSGQNSNDVN